MQVRVRFVFVRRNPLQDCGLCSTTSVRGAICGAENWRLSSRTSVRGVSQELEAESWKIRTGDFVVQLFGTRSNLWSLKLRTGDIVVQL